MCNVPNPLSWRSLDRSADGAASLLLIAIVAAAFRPPQAEAMVDPVESVSN